MAVVLRGGGGIVKYASEKDVYEFIPVNKAKQALIPTIERVTRLVSSNDHHISPVGYASQNCFLKKIKNYNLASFCDTMKFRIGSKLRMPC